MADNLFPPMAPPGLAAGTPPPSIPVIPIAQGAPPSLESPETAANDYFAGLPDPAYPNTVDAWPPPPDGAAPMGANSPVPPVDDSLGGVQHPHGAPSEWPPPPPGYQGHDVPEVQTGQGLALQHQPTEGGAPAGGAGGQPAAQGAPAAPQQGQGDPYLAAMQHANQGRITAAERQGEAEKAENNFVADETIKANDEARRKVQAATDAYNAALKNGKNKTAQLAAEAKELANTNIDEGALFKKSVVADIGFVAGAFLAGATTAALKTGHNSMIDMVNDMVAKNIQTQKDNLSNRWRGYDAKRQAMQDELALGRDQFDVDYKAAMTGLELYKNQITAGALKYKNPAVDARVQKEASDVEAAQATLTLNRANQIAETEYNHWKDKQEIEARNRGLALQAGHLNLANRQFAYEQKKDAADDKYRYDKLAADYMAQGMSAQAAGQKAQREIQKDLDERRIQLGSLNHSKGGGPLYAPSKEVAEDVNKRIGYTNMMYRKVERLNQIYDKHGWQLTNLGDDQKEAGEILTELPAIYSNAQKQGVVHPSEYEKYEKMWGTDPSSWIDPRQKWKSLQNQIEQDMNSELQARVSPDAAYFHGERPANEQPGFTPDADEKKVPAPAGLPVGPTDRHDAPERMTPEQEELVKSGKFTPTSSSKEVAPGVSQPSMNLVPVVGGDPVPADAVKAQPGSMERYIPLADGRYLDSNNMPQSGVYQFADGRVWDAATGHTTIPDGPPTAAQVAARK